MRVLLLITVVIACIGCSATHRYVGRVIDSRGHAVPHAVIVADHRYQPGSPEERFIVSSDADELGRFTLDVPVQLDYISASTADLNRRGELPSPSPNSTNTIVLR